MICLVFSLVLAFGDCELIFLESTPQFAFLGAISNLDIANIVRNNGGGCSFANNQLDCVVGNDRIGVTYTQLTQQGLKLVALETYGQITTVYYAQANPAARTPNTTLRTCSTALIDYAKTKIDYHLAQIEQEICGSDPNDCDIKVVEPCDNPGNDCISQVKNALQKLNILTASDIQTLNQFNQLIATAANKSPANSKALISAFHKLLNGLEVAAASNSFCGLTVAQCIQDVVTKTTSLTQYDKIKNYSRDDLNRILGNC